MNWINFVKDNKQPSIISPNRVIRGKLMLEGKGEKDMVHTEITLPPK